MIQEIAPSRLEIAWKRRLPRPGDVLLAEREGKLLLRREGAELALPQVTGRETGSLLYLLELDGRGIYWLENGCPAEEGLEPRDWGELRAGLGLPKGERFALLTAMHLIRWYGNTRFCAACGGPMEHGTRERVQVCPRCGRVEYPRINPVVMVAVHSGDRLLMSKYRGRQAGSYALLAGFMEIGETPEEAARREVFEETGVRIRNLRYYRSQPWALSQSLLLGFFAELDGEDTITLQEEELAVAAWIPREEIRESEDDFSLTRCMIQAFRDGTYPQ